MKLGLYNTIKKITALGCSCCKNVYTARMFSKLKNILSVAACKSLILFEGVL